MADPKQPTGGDKMPLKDFVASVRRQMVEAAQEFEEEFGPQGWETDSMPVLARAWLKPMKLPDGSFEVWVDINEPGNEPLSDIPIPIRRVPRVPPTTPQAQ